MTCSRCGGLMFEETFFDRYGDGPFKFTQAHCLLCGYYSDPTMERNRALVRAGVKIDTSDRQGVKAATTFATEA